MKKRFAAIPTGFIYLPNTVLAGIIFYVSMDTAVNHFTVLIAILATGLAAFMFFKALTDEGYIAFYVGFNIFLVSFMNITTLFFYDAIITESEILGTSYTHAASYEYISHYKYAARATAIIAILFLTIFSAIRNKTQPSLNKQKTASEKEKSESGTEKSFLLHSIM